MKRKPKEIDSWNIHIFRGKKEEVIADLPDDIAESIDTWLDKYGPD